MKVVDFPLQSATTNVPDALRLLADMIEQGDFDAAHSVAYVINCGNNRLEVGLLGHAAEPAVTAHYLLCLAQRKLENAG